MKIGDDKLRLQHGFTLIEILVGMALTGILIVGIVVTIFQVNVGTAQNKNSMYALRQVQTAGYYISRDTLQAECIGIYPADNGFPVTLVWDDPGTSENHSIKYEYDSGTRTLKRTGSINNSVNSVIQIANNINSTTSFTNNGTGYFILTVTATTGGYQPASATRTYEVEPRLESIALDIGGT
ncbi:type II secretion system protein J [Chloroflexota bacterium]